MNALHSANDFTMKASLDNIRQLLKWFGTYETLPVLLSFVCDEDSAESLFENVLAGHHSGCKMDRKVLCSESPDLLAKSNEHQSKMRELWRSCPKPTRTEWFRLLGENWTGFDDIAAWRAPLTKLFKSATRSYIAAMMNPEEIQAWKNLPEKIPAFRGCSSLSSKGFSYSLDRAVAERFPTLNRYNTATPTLISALIPKRFAVVKIDRNESEIIAVRPDKITIVRSDRI